MRRQEENLIINLDVAGKKSPECTKASTGDDADFAVSHCLDVDRKQWMT